MERTLWRQLDSGDCVLRGVRVWLVNDKERHVYVSKRPREDCALTFVLEGGYRYRSERSTEFTCRSGEMSFLPAGSCYRHESMEAPSGMYVVYFTPEGDFCLPEDIVHMTCRSPEHFRRLFGELHARYFSVIPSMGEVKASLWRIVSALAREETAMRLTEGELARIAPALEHLALAGYSVFRVSELAERCHLSEYAFRELFKKYAGTTPKAYLTERRVEQVEALLAASDMTVTAAALACGFEDPAYFFKVYRRLRGHAPMTKS